MSSLKANIVQPDKVKNFLSFMERDIQTGQVVYDSGLHTQLTAFVERMFSNPLESMISSSRGTDKAIQEMVSTIFDTFITSQKDVVKKAYKSIDSNILNYFIILNEDNFENRDGLFVFLDQYEDLDIHHKLPVNVQFLTSSAIGKMKNVEELSFAE